MNHEIEKSWYNTCRVLLGEEIGDITNYTVYLEKYVTPISIKKSQFSNKEVATSLTTVKDNAKFISHDELELYHSKLKNIKIDINKIKDIDSIVEEFKDIFYYCGGIVLGNSKFIEHADRCANSFYLYKTHGFSDSKYVAFSCMGRYGEHIFGSNGIGETKFCIKGFETYRDVRCMEIIRTYTSSDCYYVANLEGCTNCMFSFNQRSKQYLIGNHQLSKDDYQKLKDKLIQEIKEMLKSKKMIPSIPDIIGYSLEGFKGNDYEPDSSSVPDSIETAFGNVSLLLLGKKLNGLSHYKTWLRRSVPGTLEIPSALSGKAVYAPYLEYYLGIADNFVTLPESFELAKRSISLDDVKTLRVLNAAQKLKDISYTTPEAIIGENPHVEKCALYYDSRDCFASAALLGNKYCAYCYWPRQSEYMFGCHQVFSSSFCMKCYFSTNLTRSFEVSDSANCTDCYFCYNCENVRDSMFCFNAKNLKNAIGNVELPSDQYKKLKNKILAAITDELERNYIIQSEIFNLYQT